MRGTPTKGVGGGGGGSAAAAAAAAASAAAAAAAAGGGAAAAAAAAALRDPTALAIQRIKQQREERRRSAEHFKREKVEEAARIEASGMPIFDADFQRMISGYPATAEAPRPHAAPGEHEICVVVRKRPINKREIAARDWDAVTCLNPRVVVHAPKLKVDGISKYLENVQFEFDHVRAADRDAWLLIHDDGITTPLRAPTHPPTQLCRRLMRRARRRTCTSMR